ncbi:MAG: hypothetical protein NWE93_11170 [Candidatus Bathyarchaeota archaeon]|nr:hypothetical protein [Candidatus Bathyarchaeota archaeon]
MKNLVSAILILALLASTVLYVTALAPFVAAQYDGETFTDGTVPTQAPPDLDNATEAPTATPDPTPTPTPVIDPGSPLSVGGSSLEEALSQFDIFSLATMVLVVLGVVWAIVILVTIVKGLDREKK